MPHYPEGDGVYKICKFGAGRVECRYIALIGGSMREGYQFSCEKRSPLKAAIDRRVAIGQQREAGDNCKGVDWR